MTRTRGSPKSSGTAGSLAQIRISSTNEWRPRLATIGRRLCGRLQLSTQAVTFSTRVRYLSAAESSPALDQGEGRAPSTRLGQLGRDLAAQRGELVPAQYLKQPLLQDDAVLKRKTQIRVA